eukprot:3520925-Ditylum_brightwellii.AAC.1
MVLGDPNTAPVTVPSESLNDTDLSARAKSKASLLLTQNHKGHSIHFITDTDDICMGLVGAVQSKFLLDAHGQYMPTERSLQPQLELTSKGRTPWCFVS